MSFNRASVNSGNQSGAAAAAAAAAASASAASDNGGGDSLNVDCVSNSSDDPETMYASGSFRPISDDGRAKIGPLNEQEQLFITEAIKYNKRKGKAAFERCTLEKGPDQKDAKIVRHCLQELENFRMIDKCFGQKK